MKIVVGFIDTPEGHAAVDAAIAEAKLRGGSLVVVTSVRGAGARDGEKSLEVAEALEAVEGRLAGSSVDYETHEYVRGNTPAEDVMAAVEQHGADLIVIGIRKRTATGKFLLGSNALDILHDAGVPVLCVKP